MENNKASGITTETAATESIPALTKLSKKVVNPNAASPNGTDRKSL